jgi:hypothetical protein
MSKKVPYHVIRESDVELGRPSTLGNSNNFSKSDIPYTQLRINKESSNIKAGQ